MLQTQFREYRYNPGDDIATHVSKLESFARRLQELNEPISNTMLMTTILNTLPPAFRHFHSAWDSTPAVERTYKREYSLHHLKIFGSECFVRIPKQKRDDKKFGKTSKQGIFVGYEDITGNYRVWLPQENKLKLAEMLNFEK